MGNTVVKLDDVLSIALIGSSAGLSYCFWKLLKRSHDSQSSPKVAGLWLGLVACEVLSLVFFAVTLANPAYRLVNIALVGMVTWFLCNTFSTTTQGLHQKVWAVLGNLCLMASMASLAIFGLQAGLPFSPVTNEYCCVSGSN